MTSLLQTQEDMSAQPEKANVKALIEADEMFPALEDLVYAAQREVLFSFRIFDPTTKLRSPSLRAKGLKSWLDLLREVAARGVSFRILLTDFEPFLTPDLHMGAWRSVGKFLHSFHDAPDAQIICAQHEAQMSRLAEWAFWPFFLKKLSAISRSIQAGERDIAHMPGLFRYVDQDGSIRWRACAFPASMNPATHHQKLAIIDGDQAIVGGLDVDERRYDNRHHTQAPAQTWHDVSVQLSSPAVQSLRQHFVAWWNADAARQPVRGRLADYAERHKIKLPPVTPMPYQDRADQPDDGEICTLVTRSMPQQGLWVLGPRSQHTQILKKKYDLISNAAQMIYMETQFFRHVPLAQRLAAAARLNPQLELILVLPFAPEEVSFDKQYNPAHRHGEFLQIKCLDILRRAFADRLGVFGLVKKDDASSVNGRAEAHGSGVIHVHSKVMIVDDRWSLISSANSNGRSLLWDTEVGVAIDDPGFARSLRGRLWTAHSQCQQFGTLPMKGGLRHWNDTADHNAAVAHGERKGFITPYLFKPARSFGVRAALIPDNMV